MRKNRLEKYPPVISLPMRTRRSAGAPAERRIAVGRNEVMKIFVAGRGPDRNLPEVWVNRGTNDTMETLSGQGFLS